MNEKTGYGPHAQSTLNLLMLAGKDLPAARPVARAAKAETLDPVLLAEFVDHPNAGMATIAAELLLQHFPTKLRYETLVRLALSPCRTTSDAAVELEVRYHAHLVDDRRLRDLAHRHPSVAVRSVAWRELDARAEVRRVERDRARAQLKR